jgi:hypothetical protein
MSWKQSIAPTYTVIYYAKDSEVLVSFRPNVIGVNLASDLREALLLSTRFCPETPRILT